jgi:phosphatidylglycerophosphate synthase
MKRLDQKLDNLNKFFREKRDAFLLPVIKILDRLGISANNLSITKIFFVCLYLLLIESNFTLAVFLLIFGGVLLDFLDGPLARYTNTASDRGKFIDMFSDHLVYTLFIWGLMIVKIGSPLTLSYNIIIITAFYLIIIINKNESKESNWLIKPVARANYYKSAFEIAIILHIIFNMNEFIFNQVIVIINILITIHFLYHLINFSQKNTLKNN